MKEVLDFVKKNLGIEDEEKKEEQETIIVPEHSLYEIILMKAKNLDDMEDALNQIIDEKNPIIMDMSELEIKPEEFKLAGEKLKQFRQNIGGEAILICKNGKEVIIITPPEIKLIRK